MKNNPFIQRHILNNFLCNFPCKLPINASHYITGKEMLTFSKLMCVENELSNLICYGNNLYKSIKYSFKR